MPLAILLCLHGLPSVCKERGISRLVYTSTVNVVFAGKPIEEGDEDSVPYVPLDMVSIIVKDFEPTVKDIFTLCYPIMTRDGYR